MSDTEQEDNAPPPPTSPLIKLLESFGMKKKAAAPAPAKSAGKPTAEKPAVAKPAISATGKQPPAPSEMPEGPLVSVVTRNQFYRDGFRNLMKIVIIQGAVIVGLIFTLIFFIGTSQPQDRYFATTADGRIMPVLPLDKPNKETAALMSWAAQAASDVFTFGFHDYQQRLQGSSKYFTRRGWESFVAALQKSKIVEGVIQGKMVVKAQPSSAPILTQQGVFNGRYRWIVQLPLQVKSEGGTAGRTDSYNLTLVIDRVPSLENPDGVGIEQWIAAQQE